MYIAGIALCSLKSFRSMGKLVTPRFATYHINFEIFKNAGNTTNAIGMSFDFHRMMCQDALY